MGRGRARAALVAVGRPERLPLSFAQQRLWFLGQLEGPSATYNVPLGWRLRGRVDVEALTAALGDVVGRHESLRTVFPVVDGQPYQRVIPVGLAVPEVSVVRADEAGLAALTGQACGYVFDLAGEVPVRAWLFELGPDECVLVLLMHHIAGDGWSMGVLLRDLEQSYRARLRVRCRGGRRCRCSMPITRCGSVSCWAGIRTATVAGAAGAVLGLGVGGVAGSVGVAGGPAPSGLSLYRGGQVAVRIDAGLHAGLVGLAREHQVTLFMVVQAALAVLLSRSGAGTDIPIGVPVAGRGDEALHDLVGFFVNTLVLRTDLSGDPSFVELLGRVRERDLALMRTRTCRSSGWWRC